MHTALLTLWWASEGNSSYTLMFWQLHRLRSQSWARRLAYLPHSVSVWADFKPSHHPFLFAPCLLPEEFAQAHKSQEEGHLLYHPGLREAILKSGPGTGRNLQRPCALSLVLWDSPDLFSYLEPQRQVSGQPAEVLFHAGSQNSCSTAAASAKTTPRMDLHPYRKGLCSSIDLKGVRGPGQGGRNREGTDWSDTQGQEGGPRMREGSPPGLPGGGVGSTWLAC